MVRWGDVDGPLHPVSWLAKRKKGFGELSSGRFGALVQNQRKLSDFSPVAGIMACKLSSLESQLCKFMELIKLKINIWAVLNKYILSNRLIEFLWLTTIV